MEAASAVQLPEAFQAIGAATSVCQLGTFTYDGQEVMTDAQQAQAPAIMGAFNAEAQKFNLKHRLSVPESERAAQLLQDVTDKLNALLADVLSNP